MSLRVCTNICRRHYQSCIPGKTIGFLSQFVCQGRFLDMKEQKLIFQRGPWRSKARQTTASNAHNNLSYVFWSEPVSNSIFSSNDYIHVVEWGTIFRLFQGSRLAWAKEGAVRPLEPAFKLYCGVQDWTMSDCLTFPYSQSASPGALLRCWWIDWCISSRLHLKHGWLLNSIWSYVASMQERTWAIPLVILGSHFVSTCW